jgi:hypothetical protein
MKPLSPRQKFFNRSVRQIRKQGGASFNCESGCCLYREPNHRRCAIGANITNKEYKIYLEGNAVSCYHSPTPDDIDQLMIDKGFKGNDDFSFLNALQFHCHDEYHALDDEEFMEKFENSIKDFARQYDLTIPYKKEQSSL